MHATRIALVLVCTAPSVAAQFPLLSIETEGSGQSAVGPDLNGDQVRDLWVGDPWPGPSGREGRVNAHSGTDGALLQTWVGEASLDQFGGAVAVVGDLDGDGVPDLALGAPGATADASHRPYVQVRSGANGSLLLRLQGPANDSGYGSQVAGLGDVDGDGVPDLAVAARGASVYGAPPERAFAEVRSGASGALLWRTPGVAPAESIHLSGVALARYADVDGDGCSELAVGFASSDHVELRSGASGAVLSVLTAPPGAGFGHPTAFGGALDAGVDFDGDGLEDLLVGAPLEAISTGGGTGYEGTPHLGAVYVLSGAALNGPPLVRVTAFLGEAGFGWSVAALGDASGDGSADFVAGNWSTRAGCCFFYPGSARVHSGVDGAFVQSGGYGSNGRLGRAGDWNGDGLQDYLVQLDSDYQTGSFQTRIVAGRPPLPMPNPDCAGTPNGCQPMIFTTSTPSPQATTPFGIHATGFEEGLQGFLLLGTGERAEPFGAGQLCIARPFARFVAQRRDLAENPWCPIAQSYVFEPGQLGQGPLAPGETFYGQFFALGPAGPGAIETSGSIRVQVWP